MKRAFLIAGIVLAVLLAAFLGYYFLIYRKAVPPNAVDIALPADKKVTLTPEEIRKGVTLEQKHEELRQQLGVNVQNAVTVVKILDKRVMRAVLSADGGRIQFFDPERKKFFSVDLEGKNEQALGSGTFENISDVQWSRDREAILLTIGTEPNAKYAVLTTKDQKLSELDPRLRYPVFSPDGLRIFYLFSDEKKGVHRLSISLRDGTEPKGLRSYRGGLMQLFWYGPEDLAYGGVSSGYEAASAYAMDTRGEKTRTLVADQYALDLTFAPDGSRVAFSQAGRKPTSALLLLMKSDGRDVKETNLRTLARKCAWSSTGITLYCGVPFAPQDETVLPEDYETGHVVTRDNLYRINGETGEATALVLHNQFTEGYDISESFLTSDLTRMYFTRRNDGKLYAYRFPQ